MSDQVSLVPRPELSVLTPATRKVIAAITSAGGRPYLVGGWVRDALLSPGTPSKDVDIEVFDLGMDELVRALRTVGQVDEVGRAFSVVKLRLGRGPDVEDFDVSVPRREVLTGPGHRGFDVVPDPGASLPGASARRDFTVNALMFDPVAGVVVDCWGGLGDLEAGVLRHTSPAFVEDPLRVLRAAGFASRFSFALDPGTAELCRGLVSRFAELSVERVWGEWEKITTRGTDISAALSVLEGAGWLGCFPVLAALRGAIQDPVWHPEGDVLTHSGLAADQAARLADEAGLTGQDRAIVVLAALLHDVGKPGVTRQVCRDGQLRVTSQGHAGAGAGPADEFLRAVGAPRAVREQVVPLVVEHMSATGVGKVTGPAVRRLARRLVPATIQQWALVVEADKGGRGSGSVPGGTGPWLELAERLGTQRAPVPRLLRGEHLMAAGLVPGPSFGPLLEQAVQAQDGGLFDDTDGAVAWLNTRLRVGPVST